MNTIKNVALILILTLTLSCTNNSRQKIETTQVVKETDSAKKVSMKVVANKTGATTGNQDSTTAGYNPIESKLTGLWVAEGSDNVTFEIRKHTFYYPEHFSSYNYEIIGDSVKVHYDGFDQSFAYMLDGKDKLTLIGADGERNLYKRKK